MTKTKKSDTYTVTVNGKSYVVKLDSQCTKATVNNSTYDIDVKEGSTSLVKKSSSSSEGTEIKAPLPGKITKVLVKVGDKIEKEDTVAIIEAMKMETEIKSPVAGTISSIDVEFGTDVLTDQAIMTVEE